MKDDDDAPPPEGDRTDPRVAGKAGAAAPAASSAAKSAGRGGIAIAFAKIYFMITGLAQQIALGNVLGAGGYGALSTVMGAASISYNPLIQTGIQGVSRPVAPADPAQRPTVIRAVLKVHFALGILAAGLFLVLAPLIASLQGAPHLTGTIRLFAAILLAYGLYGPLVGILNGQQRYVQQAALDVVAATLRTGAMVGLAWWFKRTYDEGVDGAAIGFSASAAAMFLIAATLTGFGKKGTSSVTLRAHLVFIAPLLLNQLILNVLLQADLQLLGRFARDAAEAAGLGAAEGDELAGAYRAAQLFGFLPYQLLIAVSFVLFPMLARAASIRDRQAMSAYVQIGVRLALILAGLAVSISAGLSEELLRLVFPNKPFDELGGDAMRVLVVGLGSFAIFGILQTVLNSLGHERAAMMLTGAACLLIGGLCYVFVHGTPLGPGLLVRTAAATAVGHFVATLLAAALVKRTAGAVVSPVSLMRVVVACAISATIAYFLPGDGQLMTLVHATLTAIVYIGLLVLSGELGRQDLRTFAAVLPGRRR